MIRRAFAWLTIAFMMAAAPAWALGSAGTAPLAMPLMRLQERLDGLAHRAPGDVAVSVRDLRTGETIGYNAQASLPAASTIKVPVMVEVFRQLELGKFTLEQEMTLQNSDRDDGWGDLADAPAGSRYTVRRLLWLMITESDNTAANMLIRLVGRAHVNQTMRALGLDHTELSDYIRSYGDIRSIRTTAGDMAKLMAMIAHGEIVDEWSCGEMLEIMAGQQINTLLPASLPSDVVIAHKTGSLHDTLNDVGVVYVAGAPYAIAVMTTHLWSLEAGRTFIREVSSLAYKQISTLAHQRADGAVAMPERDTTIVHPAVVPTVAPFTGVAAPKGALDWQKVGD
ncbi:MAG TPA: serine hydrolase [Candidatus Dormibacteraeota bacterium]|nr:serine hydrolase [Candidatus Dormibacteraeota bacterium]